MSGPDAAAVQAQVQAWLAVAEADRRATFRKTHDLRELGDAVAVKSSDLAPVIASMEEWTIWNVAYRYPTEELPEPEPTSEDLRRALDTLGRLAARLGVLAARPTA